MDELLLLAAPYFDSTAAENLSMSTRSTGVGAAPGPAEADDTKAKAPAGKEAAKKPATRKAAPSRRPAPAKKAAAAETSPQANALAAVRTKRSEAAGKPSKKAAKLRPRLVRDSFTTPEADFDLIAALKAKALDARRAAKQCELLRAGLRLLSGLQAKALAAALDKLEPVKIGRPKKGH